MDIEVEEINKYKLLRFDFCLLTFYHIYMSLDIAVYVVFILMTALGFFLPRFDPQYKKWYRYIFATVGIRMLNGLFFFILTFIIYVIIVKAIALFL